MYRAEKANEGTEEELRRSAPLSYSDYPKAKDVSQHGLQPLPPSLPFVDFARAEPHRSSRYSTVLETELTKEQLLQMAWVIAAGFARREPQARYLWPPKHPPAGFMEARHTDPFGTDSFGSWDTETQMYWIVRLTALTDPTSPQDAIEVNEETLTQSLAILDGEGRVIGAAFNETMAPLDVEPPLREGYTHVEYWESEAGDKEGLWVFAVHEPGEPVDREEVEDYVWLRVKDLEKVAEHFLDLPGAFD